MRVAEKKAEKEAAERVRVAEEAENRVRVVKETAEDRVRVAEEITKEMDEDTDRLAEKIGELKELGRKYGDMSSDMDSKMSSLEKRLDAKYHTDLLNAACTAKVFYDYHQKSGKVKQFIQNQWRGPSRTNELQVEKFSAIFQSCKEVNQNKKVEELREMIAKFRQI